MYSAAMMKAKGRGCQATAVVAATIAVILGLAAHAPAQDMDGLETQQSRSVEEYERLARQMELSNQRQQELEQEIAAIRDDSAAVTAALIQTVKTERKLAEDIAAIGGRLRTLGEREQDIRASLQGRRTTLAEVLAALQRMGLNPPPAMLVRPEDALSSVRSAILMGAVVPEIRAETDALAADLRELSHVMTSIRAEQERLRSRRLGQLEEKERLTLLLQEKQRLQSRVESRMEQERTQAEELAQRARSMQELIASLESEIESVREALARQQRETGSLEGPGRLTESLPFSERRGLLYLPVMGVLAGRFGEDDVTGSPLNGDIVRTQSGAIVTAPADGTVLYAGPFRSYGQLLILNPGDGYHVVLAGMDRLTVSLGDSVLAGEPVGMMGEARLASISASAVGGTTPELYIEFRKDGQPIDPRPWWARELSGRMQNDT